MFGIIAQALLANLPAALVVGIFGPLASAATAIAVVALTHRYSHQRDQNRRQHEELGQRLEQEREVISDLIAALHPWRSAIESMYLGIWYRYNDNRRSVRPEVYKKAVRDIEHFAAALWKARVTSRNPYARATLDELTIAHQDLTDLVDEYGSDRSKHDEVTSRLEQLGSDIERNCRSLEAAMLSWEGTVPDLRNYAKPEL